MEVSREQGHITWLLREQRLRGGCGEARASIRCMMQRTTVTAAAEDLDVLRREAQQRHVSLSCVLEEVVHEAAEARRRERSRPRALFNSHLQWSVALESVEDEESPVRGRLQS
jgi:hypothetical protein